MPTYTGIIKEKPFSHPGRAETFAPKSATIKALGASILSLPDKLLRFMLDIKPGENCVVLGTALGGEYSRPDFESTLKTIEAKAEYQELKNHHERFDYISEHIENKLNRSEKIQFFIWLLNVVPDEGFKERIALSLGKLKVYEAKVSEAVPALLETLAKATKDYLKQTCVLALGNIKADSAVPRLSFMLLNDSNEVTRSYAATALRIIKNRKAIPPLLRSLFSDKNAMVRDNAATALVVFGGIKTAEQILKAIIDNLDNLSFKDELDAGSVLACILRRFIKKGELSPLRSTEVKERKSSDWRPDLQGNYFDRHRKAFRIVSIDPEYADLLPPDLFGSPYRFIESLPIIERGALFNLLHLKGTARGYDVSKVREFNGLVFKHVDQRSVSHPLEEIEVAEKVRAKLEAAGDHRFKAQEFVGFVYDWGKYFLISKRENAQDLFETMNNPIPLIRRIIEIKGKPDIKEIIKYLSEIKAAFKWLQAYFKEDLKDVTERNVLVGLTDKGTLEFTLIDFETR